MDQRLAALAFLDAEHAVGACSPEELVLRGQLRQRAVTGRIPKSLRYPRSRSAIHGIVATFLCSSRPALTHLDDRVHRAVQ